VYRGGRDEGMDQPWQIELFGWLRAQRGTSAGAGDQVVSRFRTQKAALLLAYLAYYRQRSHPREALIERLWPESDPQAGRINLRTELHSLRRQLEPPGVPPGAVLLATRAAVQLNPAACITDVARFEAALVAAKRAAGVDERVQHLTAAAELYRGELLPGCFEDWVLAERQRLAEAFLQALHELVGLQEEMGDWPGALQWARRAVAADPLSEESHQRLIRLLLESGQVEAARAQYEQSEELLLRELGSGLPPEIREQIRDRAPGKDRPPAVSVGKRGPGRWPNPQLAGSEQPSTNPTASLAVDAIARTTPPLPSTDATARPSDNLPLRFTRFFGREVEIATLVEMLGSTHPGAGEFGQPTAAAPGLVTMTGPGGTGKTRLAQQVAQELRDAFPGGVWFVSLRDLTDPALIPDQILLALRLPRSPQSPPLEQVAQFLSRAPALLVLDNYEHLVEGGAEIVQLLLEQADHLTVLVTSRQRLSLEGEREFPLAPLPIPDPSRDRQRAEASTTLPDGRGSDLASLVACPSVALFVDRAQAARPDFQVTPYNAPAVAALCQRLEGLPLATELAAARAGVLTPQQMLSRLEQRFELLVGRPRSADPRHRSLRATLDWSYELLTPELQRFFARLSIFRGGWTLEAAEAVCEEPRALEYLEELQHCSLVQSEADGEAMRYSLLETLREYGAEQLTADERTALAERHLAFYMALSEDTGPEIGVKFEVLPAWLDQAEREHDNLRAALDWLVRSTAVQEWLLQVDEVKHPSLIVLLTNFWQERGYQAEGRRRLAELLAFPGAAGASLPRAYLLHEAGALAAQQGDLAAADALVQESLAICRELGSEAGELWCCSLLAVVARDQGDYTRARSCYERTTAIAQELGEGWECDTACALYGTGYTAYLEGDLSAAQALLERGLQLLRNLCGEAAKGIHPQARDGIAWVYAHLGELADARGHYSKAQAYLEESLDRMRVFRFLSGPAYVQQKLGRVAQHQGRWDAATARYGESLMGWCRIGNLPGIAECLEGFGAVAAGEGDSERAAWLFGAAAALRESGGIPVPPVHRADLKHGIAAARVALGESAFAIAWAAGQALPLEQAIAAALRRVTIG
jgi:predicted ATPase/DNA-binding SARP family transcriptional activator